MEVFGEMRVIELCPGGEKKSVTAANRHEYVRLVVEYGVG
eukprot:gene2838-19943_t